MHLATAIVSTIGLILTVCVVLAALRMRGRAYTLSHAWAERRFHERQAEPAHPSPAFVLAGFRAERCGSVIWCGRNALNRVDDLRVRGWTVTLVYERTLE